MKIDARKTGEHRVIAVAEYIYSAVFAFLCTFVIAVSRLCRADRFLEELSVGIVFFDITPS